MSAPPGPPSEPRYDERGELGRGGMGQVLRVGDRDLGRDVAMKVVHGSQDPDRLQRFLNEARITGQLEHPNIVPVHELGTDPQGRSYFTMKLIEGESLEHILAQLEGQHAAYVAQYPLARLLQIYLKVCDAVGFAHSRGVIHRDLKPENVMVGEFGEVLVVDWGLAKARGMAEAASPERSIELPADAAAGLTLEGDLMGTPAYMAPEQARADHAAVDSRTDVFALGALLYAILTLRAPYEHDNTFAAIRAAQQRELTPPAQRAPGRAVPPELASICLKAMAADRVARYEDAADLESDVTAYLEQRLVGAHRYSAAARATRFVQRHPTGSLATAVGTAILAVAGAVLGVITSQRDAADARAETSRVQAEAAHKNAELSAFREQVAAERATQAETSIEKMKSVARVLRRARAELGGVAKSLMRRRWSSDPRAANAPALAELRATVAAFGESVDDTPAAQATWLAVRGWMLWSEGEVNLAFESFRAARQTDRDVPSGQLFEAMALLSTYMAQEAFPAYHVTDGRLAWNHKPIEGTVQEQTRRRFEGVISEIRTAKAWGETSAEDMVRAFDALKHWYGADLAAAVEAFGVALRIPEMEWLTDELLFMRARGRLLLDDYEGALTDLAAAIESDTLGAGPWRYVAQVHQMRAINARLGDDDPRPSWKLAVEHYEETARRYPGQANIDGSLASIRRSQARWAAEHGDDPLPYLDAAMADIERAIAWEKRNRHDFNTAVSFSVRSLLRVERAGARRLSGAAATDELRLALDDMLEALTWWSNIVNHELLMREAVDNYARQLSAQGIRPLPVLRRWIEQLESDAAVSPGAMRPVAARAELYHALDEVAPERAMRERQSEMYGEPRHALPDRIAKLKRREAEPEWRQLLARGMRWMHLGDFIEGARLLRAAGAAHVRDPDPDAELSGTLFWRIARAEMIASAGQATLGPGDAWTRPTPDEAAAMRLRALDALERSATFDWSGRPNALTDPVFRALHGHPRFEALRSD